MWGRDTLVCYSSLAGTCHFSSCTLQHSHIKIVNICNYSFISLLISNYIYDYSLSLLFIIFFSCSYQKWILCIHLKYVSVKAYHFSCSYQTCKCTSNMSLCMEAFLLLHYHLYYYGITTCSYLLYPSSHFRLKIMI